MSPLSATRHNANRDRYPSRQPGQSASAQPRLDPVVYSPDLAEAPLSQTSIARYREQGFLVIDQLFSRRELAVLQAEADRLRKSKAISALDETICEPGSQKVRSIFRIHALSQAMNDLSQDPRLVNIAEYLLGDQVYIHQSRLNYKPAFRGKEFYWHSDFETWHVEDGMPAMRALSMSISLTANCSSNGPLLLIPGSHREYLACEGETPEENYKSSLQKQVYGTPDETNLRRLADVQGISEFIGEPGSVCVFDSNLLHGSNSNISPYPRSNVFLVYNALSNAVVSPFSKRSPRPEYICARDNIAALSSHPLANSTRD